VHDNAGNIYTSSGISVTVDNVAPIITRVGSGTISIEKGSTYTDS